MIPRIQEAELVTDLEAGFNDFLNVGNLDPVPANLVSSSDPRLSDARVPLDGSVTNASVAPGAAIDQSKLNLDGVIPTAWLGTTSTTAAEGDLTEYLANKGQPNGYASLDGGGKIPVGQVPSAVGTGTVTSVGLTMPPELVVSSSPVTSSGVLGVNWVTQADLSWFGNKQGAPASPRVYTDAFAVAMIPPLDASKIVSGVFPAARLPIAVGIGVGHAPGAVPDPGPTGGGALPTDYLARDMTYKPIPGLAIAYQPNVDDPVLTPTTNITGPRTVVSVTDTPGATVFYSLTSAVAGFAEMPSSGYISLAGGATMWSYAAASGFNNSNIVNYTNPNP